MHHIFGHKFQGCTPSSIIIINGVTSFTSFQTSLHVKHSAFRKDNFVRKLCTTMYLLVNIVQCMSHSADDFNTHLFKGFLHSFVAFTEEHFSVENECKLQSKEYIVYKNANASQPMCYYDQGLISGEVKSCRN